MLTKLPYELKTHKAMNSILTIKEYSKQVGIPENMLKSSRKDQHKIPRQIYWLYLNSKGISKRSIARLFQMDHSSVINGIRTITNLLETRDKILSNYQELISSFIPTQRTG